MSQPAFLAIPGDAETPTGGYIYDAKVIAASGGDLRPIALPGSFPFPDNAALEETRAALAAADGPVIIDGLAYGALPVDLIKSLPRKPIALCHHPLGMETGLTADEARALIASERAALECAAHVIVTSKETKGILVAEFGVAPADITVAEPGQDIAQPCAEARGEIAETPLILTVASLTPRKAHEILVAALSRLAQNRLDLPWRAIFAGPDDLSPETTATIRRAIEEAGLQGRITLSYPKERAGLEAIYDEASIFALPSRFEGYGMVFPEAMLRAFPIVACDVGAAGAIAPPGAVKLLPVDDVEAFETALEELLASPDLRRSMGSIAREHALTLPGWDATWAGFQAAMKAAE